MYLTVYLKLRVLKRLGFTPPFARRASLTVTFVPIYQKIIIPLLEFSKIDFHSDILDYHSEGIWNFNANLLSP
jgi:hypothetical protein